MANAEIIKKQEAATSLMVTKQREFRSNLQKLLDVELGANGRFQAILSELEPKDYIDTIIRMMPYAYSKAPEEKPAPAPNVEIEKTVVRQKLSTPTEQ